MTRQAANPRGVTPGNEGNDSSGYDRAYRAEYERRLGIGQTRAASHGAAMAVAAQSAYRGTAPRTTDCVATHSA